YIFSFDFKIECMSSCLLRLCPPGHPRDLYGAFAGTATAEGIRRTFDFRLSPTFLLVICMMQIGRFKASSSVTAFHGRLRLPIIRQSLLLCPPLSVRTFSLFQCRLPLP